MSIFPGYPLIYLCPSLITAWTTARKSDPLESPFHSTSWYLWGEFLVFHYFFFFRINLLNPKTNKQNYASDKDNQRLGLSSLKQSFLVCEHGVSVHSFATLSCKFSEYKPCTHFIKFILKFLYFMPPAQKIFNFNSCC